MAARGGVLYAPRGFLIMASDTKILIGHGFKFGPSPLDTTLLPMLQAMALKFGFDIETREWDEMYGFAPYVSHSNIIAVTHSYFCNRFQRDMLRLAGNFEFKSVIWCPIDPVFYTLNSDLSAMDSDMSAQLKGAPMIVPGNVTACKGYHRKLVFDRAAPVFNLLELPVSALLDGAEDVEISGVSHSSICAAVESDVLAFINSQL